MSAALPEKPIAQWSCPWLFPVHAEAVAALVAVLDRTRMRVTYG